MLALRDHFLRVRRQVAAAALFAAVAAEPAEKVRGLADRVQHLLRLNRVVAAVVLHRVLEVCRHHAHHYRPVVDSAAHVVLSADVNRAGRVKRCDHAVVRNPRRTHAGHAHRRLVGNFLRVLWLNVVIYAYVGVDGAGHPVRVVLGLHDVRVLVNAIIHLLLVLLDGRELQGRQQRLRTYVEAVVVTGQRVVLVPEFTVDH